MVDEEMIPKQGPVIAIDGPAGTGKSTATRRICEALGFVHIDTGALYRSIAYLLREEKEVDLGDPGVGVHSEDIQEVAVGVARNAHLEFRRMVDRNPSNRIFANGKDVSDYIRTPEISTAASKVSAIPGVRSALLGVQRRLGCVGRSVLEGRDIGTVIFPDADVKFFLTASVDERAKRRLAELEGSGSDTPSFEELKQQIQERDDRDTNRATAPMKKAADAIEIDTSHMTLDEVVLEMVRLSKEKLGMIE